MTASSNNRQPNPQANQNTHRPIQNHNIPRPAKNGSNGGNLHNSGNTKGFNLVSYTREEEIRIQRALNKVLGPEYVSFRPGGGGQNVSYIEGWKALNLANEIFGFNGWSSQLISVQVDFMDSHGSGRVSLGLSVVVRITIKDGTFHEDFGYGFIENAKNKAMAFEKCKKEAFTDGLKRCLRCFGNVLGNCLYDKTIIAKMQKVKLPPSELEHDDFHRDPLVLKREREKLMQAARTLVAKTLPPQPSANGSNSHQNLPRNIATPVEKVPNVVKGYDLADFDDLFQFSDDLPGDDGGELNDRLDDYELELLLRGGEKPENEESKLTNSDTTLGNTDTTMTETPSQVFFTSSKKALEVQQTTDQLNVPQFDHKFVSKSVRRTVDPSKSVKIRRNDLPTAYTPSQMNRTKVTSPSLPSDPQIGKRPLGMPPSQRQPSKRLHKELSETGEKENETRAESL